MTNDPKKINYDELPEEIRVALGLVPNNSNEKPRTDKSKADGPK